MAATSSRSIPRRRVIGLAFGGVRSVRRGVGSDVASTREYRPGDDVGWMDWAASARLSAARGSDEFIVRERFADEAPRVVVLADRRPSMSIGASPLRPLDKPQAIAHRARADRRERDRRAQPHRLPRLRRRRAVLAAAAHGAPRGAGHVRRARSPRPADTVSQGLEFLGEHRRDLPTQAFVFVVSDFLVPPDLRRLAARARAPLGARAGDRSRTGLGADASPTSAASRAVRRAGQRARRARLADVERRRRGCARARGALGRPRPRLPLARDRAVAVQDHDARRDARRVPALGRPAADVAWSGRVKRVLLARVVAAALRSPPAR